MDAAWRSLFGVLSPPLRRICGLCAEPAETGIDLCPACQADMPWNRHACGRCGLPLALAVPLCGRCQRQPTGWDRTWAPLRYDWPLAPLLTRFKFGADLVAGQMLAELWARQTCPPDLPEALLPVPLHPSRLRQRGYNQAHELARVLARRHGLPLRSDLLRRHRRSAPQTSLASAARRRNLRGAFAVTASDRQLPAHIALVDDVMTTGATVQACSTCLRAAGVTRIDIWVLARAAIRP